MSEELKPESAPFVRALDDSGKVRDDERPVIGELYDAEIRGQRRERVVADFGMRRGHDGEKRRLARIRLADQPDVRDELELELQRAYLAVFAGLILARRLMRRRRE